MKKKRLIFLFLTKFEKTIPFSKATIVLQNLALCLSIVKEYRRKHIQKYIPIFFIQYTKYYIDVFSVPVANKKNDTSTATAIITIKIPLF